MRILIVEQDGDTRDCLQAYLQDLGYTVLTAADVEQGRALLNSRGFDVLISDLRLPDGECSDLLATRDSREPLMAITMSGLGRNADAFRSRELGCQHHLFKPFRLGELEKLLIEAA